MKIPKKWTVLQDTREQTPIKFPDRLVLWPETAAGPYEGKPVVATIEVVPRKFDTGDYLLEGYESITGIERKKGVDELAQNLLSKDRHRFMSALGNFLDAVKHPILFIDSPPTKFFEPRGTDQEPGRVLDRLYNTLAIGGVDIIWAGTSSSKLAQRRRIGEVLLRRMISYVLWEKRK